MLDDFINMFCKGMQFDEGQRALLGRVLSKKRADKGTLLLRSGEVARHVFFVRRGCLRSYTVDNAGAEHIFQFAVEGWMISDLYSFLTREPGMYWVDAIEDSEVFVLDLEGRDKLLDAVPGMERMVRIAMEGSYIAHQRRVHSLLSDSLEQRYVQFIAAYSQIAGRVPQWMLASYLGTSPETISRIRRRISFKR